MDKVRHGKRGKVRFPLFGDGGPQRDSIVNNKDFKSMVAEVKDVLSGNSNKIGELAVEIAKVINRFSSGKATLKDARAAANNFARYFELDDGFVEDVERHIKNLRLISYASFHINQDNKTVHKISFNSLNVSIQQIHAGEDGNQKATSS